MGEFPLMAQNMKRIRAAAAPLLLVLLLVTGAASSARADEAGEYKVKAAFLYNFAKFTEWPDRAFTGPAEPMSFCVMGDDPFGDALDSIKGKTVKEHKVVVKRMSGRSDAGSCHVLFISSSEDGRLEEIISALGQAPVLLVGDMNRFAQRGGMIKFLVENNRVSFEINAGAAKGAGLKISSQLLKLAKTVIE
jgi:hypothetical protein